jgi:hypothetical protein
MAKRPVTKTKQAKAGRVEVRGVPGGRAIRWDQWDLGRLDDAGRARAGRSWASRMKQEHLAVGAFAMLVTELAAEGCDPIVLSLLTRASSDEVRHTEICRKMAVGLLGEDEVPRRIRGVPSIPKYLGVAAETRNLLHVVEMCCLSETFTGVYLTEMLSRMETGSPRMAVESLLEDEIDHGRVGWAFLASRAESKRVEGLSAALPAMLDRTMSWVMEGAATRPEPDKAELEAVGYLGSSAGGAIFQRTFRDVILPGFEACGVDVGPAKAHGSARHWI